MQELLAEGDFVRSLARQLIGREDAEDLAQETWLAVLRTSPSSLQQPRSWLARVVRRLAANRRRADVRRVFREHDAATRGPSEAPSTAEIVACEQVRQRVVAAVLALDEPFRGTVLARFYECLDSETIAARDRVEVATVRSRLKRGLERLRARLDVEHAGQRGAWATPLGLLNLHMTANALSTGAVMSIPKKVAAIAAVVLFAGFAVWHLAPELPVTPDLQVAAVTSKPAAVQAGELPNAADPSLRVAPVSLATATNGPRELPAYPVVDQPIDDVIVRVLDDVTRQPVAGAEVVFAPFRVDFTAPSTRGDRALHEMANSDAFLERFGSRARTGADGTTTIRLPRSGGQVIARHGDRWVRDHLRPEMLLAGERASLWLTDPRWVQIRLVDEVRGAPVAGELVDVGSSATGPVVTQWCNYGGTAGPSDADGMIRIPWSVEHTDLRVRPWTVGASKFTSLELPAALARVTEVRYPATGSMTVELRTPSGALWPTPIQVTMTTPSGGSSPTSGPVSWCSATPGVYQMAHVELGMRWQMRAATQRFENIDTIPVEVAGPTRAGEDVLVILRARTEPCRLRATLRLRDGSPLPQRLFAAVEQSGAGWLTTRCWVPLTEDGSVGWTLVEAPALASGQIRLRDAFTNAMRYQGDWRLEAPPTPGEHDLGTLVVTEPPLVVAGELLFDSQPQGSPLHVLCEAEAADGSWSLLHEVVVPLDGSPSFEVREFTQAKNVRVTVRADRHVLAPAPVVVRTGTEDLRLVMQRGVNLRARVLAPAAYAQAITCRAVREDGAALPATSANLDQAELRGHAELVDFDGLATQYLWPALPPGSYRVEVLVPGVATPVALVSGVRVQDGVAPDARLDPIDLRERTRMLTVAIEGPFRGPRPITDGGAVAFPTGQRGGAQQGTEQRTLPGLLFDAQGRAQLAVGPDPVDVIVAVPGFRIWRATAVTESLLVVQLEPRLEVPFRLAPRLATALAGHRVHVIVEPRATDAADETGATIYCLRRPGERLPAVQASSTSLQRLNGDGICILEAGETSGAIPISAEGMFGVRLAVEAAPQWVHIGEMQRSFLGGSLQPSSLVVHGTNDPEVVFDVEDPVLGKLGEVLARPR